MQSDGRIVDQDTGGEMSMADMRSMHENVKAQVESPDRKKKDHIKLSTIWNTTQSIRSIQRDLVAGYSFDKDKLTEMVNAMFSFINGIVSPDQKAQVERMKTSGSCLDCKFSFENDNKEPCCLQHKGVLTQEAIAVGCNKYEKAE